MDGSMNQTAYNSSVQDSYVPDQIQHAAIKGNIKPSARAATSQMLHRPGVSYDQASLKQF